MNICRLCLSEGLGFSPLFGMKTHVQKLVNQMQEVIGFQFPQVSTWPSKICPECIGEIASVVNFCDKIKQTQLTIEARYGEIVAPPVEKLDNVPILLDNGEVYQIKYLDNADQSDEEGTSISMERLVVDVMDLPEAVVVVPPSTATTAAPTSTTTTTVTRKSKPVILSVAPVTSPTSTPTEPSPDRKSKRRKRSPAPEDPQELPEYTSKPPSGAEINAALRKFGVLSCKLCPGQLDFDNFRSTKVHNDEVHDLAGVACCAKMYGSRFRLYEHVQFHLTPENTACDICQKRFKSRASLKIHKEDQHAAGDDINCDSCDFTCKSDKILKRHVLTHIPKENRTVACEVCDFKCNFPSQLTAHIKTKHSEYKEKHTCSECGKDFSTKGNLMNHFRSFHDPNAVKSVCGQCGKSVRRLSRHLSICQTKLSLKCPECSNVHPNMHALRTHILRMHKKDKSKLTCEICNKVLSREAHLKEHMASHTKTALYKCQFCDKEFYSNSNMYKHLRQKHYEKWKATKEFNQKVSN